MELTVNLSGIPIHVGFWRDGTLYRVDEQDVYVTNAAGDCVAQIDDVDALGEHRPGKSWLSLRFLAEEQADQISGQWDRDAKRDLISDRHAG